jgi:hypothetical protein
VDAQGTRWALGAYAAMHCSTIGRHATSRGLADRVGVGRAVTIDVGDCDYCAGFAGDAVIGENALPPFHPNRSWVAS